MFQEHPIFLYFLLLEAVILFCFVSLMVIHRTFSFFFKKLQKKVQDALSQEILSLLEEKRSYDPKKFPIRKGRRILLRTLESFDLKVLSGHWNYLKKSIVEDLLIKSARKKSMSFFWYYRNFSARVFALCPFPEDEERILKLVLDKEFIVREPASIASIRLESSQGVYHAIEGMATQTGYRQFFYRDLLLNGSKKVIEMVIHFAEDPKLHIAALQVLAAKSWGVSLAFLPKDLESQDPIIREKAFEVLIRNAFPEGQKYLEKGIYDENIKVRLNALKALKNISIDPFLESLNQMLEDPCWDVRLEAASALKRGGEKGIQVLKEKKEGRSFEVAQYALQFR